MVQQDVQGMDQGHEICALEREMPGLQIQEVASEGNPHGRRGTNDLQTTRLGIGEDRCFEVERDARYTGNLEEWGRGVQMERHPAHPGHNGVQCLKPHLNERRNDGHLWPDSTRLWKMCSEYTRQG